MQRERTDDEKQNERRVVFAVARVSVRVPIRPWGDVFRVVMAKARRVMTPTEQFPEVLESIIEGLFSRHDPSPWNSIIGPLWTRVGDEGWITVSTCKAPQPE